MRDLAAYALGVVIASGLAVGTALAPAGTPSGAPRTPATDGAPSASQTPTSPPVIPTGMEVPSGWRVETYGTVAFAVPSSWGDSGPTVCRGADLFDVRDASRPPRVERPGPMPAIGCSTDEEPVRAEATVAGGGTFVEVDAMPSEATPSSPHVEGDRASFSVDGIGFAVQAEPALRKQILATFVSAPTGANGCEPTIGSVAGARPAGPAPADVGTVTSVSACRYTQDPGVGMVPCPIAGCGPTTPVSTVTTPGGDGARLHSSVRLEGQAAQAAVAALKEAPSGTVPDRPQDCAPEVALGEEVLVVRLDGTAGTSQVLVRYAGCVGRGIDDGAARGRSPATWPRPCSEARTPS